MKTPEFHRLEEYNYDEVRSNLAIVCSFKTERFGYVQVQMKRTQDKYHGELINNWKFETLAQEPDLNMFTESNIHHMEIVTRIVWRLVYDTPAAKDRFEQSQPLYSESTYNG